MPSKYKYDKDGKMTHFKHTKKDKTEGYYQIDDPSGADYLEERFKAGYEQPEVDEGRKAAKKRRDE